MARFTHRVAWTPHALLALSLLAACGDEDTLFSDDGDVEICGLAGPGGRRYCIDVYEASRTDANESDPGIDDTGRARSLPDRLPWVNVTWAGAQAACAARGARLCDAEEWIDGCDGMVGDGGTVYTYGNTRTPEACIIGDGQTQPGGSKDTCMSTLGTFDQSGNAWEWTNQTAATAAARGGGYRSTQGHRCSDVRPSVSSTETDTDLGFRCCRSL